MIDVFIYDPISFVNINNIIDICLKKKRKCYCSTSQLVTCGMYEHDIDMDTKLSNT